MPSWRNTTTVRGKTRCYKSKDWIFKFRSLGGHIFDQIVVNFTNINAFRHGSIHQIFASTSKFQILKNRALTKSLPQNFHGTFASNTGRHPVSREYVIIHCCDHWFTSKSATFIVSFRRMVPSWLFFYRFRINSCQHLPNSDSSSHLHFHRS